MNRTQNTTYSSFGPIEKGNRCNKSAQPFSARIGIIPFEIFTYSTTYHEKLPIIYANIRVWNAD